MCAQSTIHTLALAIALHRPHIKKAKMNGLMDKTKNKQQLNTFLFKQTFIAFCSMFCDLDFSFCESVLPCPVQFSSVLFLFFLLFYFVFIWLQFAISCIARQLSLYGSCLRHDRVDLFRWHFVTIYN